MTNRERSGPTSAGCTFLDMLEFPGVYTAASFSYTFFHHAFWNLSNLYLSLILFKSCKNCWKFFFFNLFIFCNSLRQKKKENGDKITHGAPKKHFKISYQNKNNTRERYTKDILELLSDGNITYGHFVTNLLIFKFSHNVETKKFRSSDFS